MRLTKIFHKNDSQKKQTHKMFHKKNTQNETHKNENHKNICQK